MLRSLRLATRILLLPILLAAFSAGVSSAQTIDDELRVALSDELDRQRDLRRSAGVEDSVWRDLAEFYRRRDDRPLWSDGLSRRPMVEELIEALEEAPSMGLEPEEYGYSRLRALARDEADPASIAALDVHASEAFVRFGLHLARGRVSANAVDPQWRVALRRADVWGALASASGGEPVNQALFALEPRSRFYADTKNAYAKLRKTKEKGGWGTVAAGDLLGLGAKHSRVEQLRKRLYAEGALPKKAAKGKKFDTELERALINFQNRNLLKPTGVLDTATITALNVPIEERLHQLALNLERARWMADDPPGMGVFVNVPDFALTVMDRDRELLRSKVITGRYYHPTPVLNDSIVSVVLNPTWTVPQSIAVAEILPAVQQDSTFLSRKGIRVFTRERKGLREVDATAIDWTAMRADNFRYQFRQDPGPENPLGRLKFVLTNDQFIYLHDTPSAHLFEMTERTGSYGCIRVERPFELARFILDPSEPLSDADLQEKVASGKTSSLRVRPPVPVRVTYWTAWSDASGLVSWRHDPYRVDYLHEWALENRYQPDPYAAAERVGEPSAEAQRAAASGAAESTTPRRAPSR